MFMKKQTLVLNYGSIELFGEKKLINEMGMDKKYGTLILILCCPTFETITVIKQLL